MKKVILLASGGLDSTTVAYKLAADGIQFVPVFFDYGQHCVEIEWDRVNEVLPAGSPAPERVDVPAGTGGEDSAERGERSAAAHGSGGRSDAGGRQGGDGGRDRLRRCHR